MSQSKRVLKIGFAACVIVLAAAWLKHLLDIHDHGASYTYAEIALFAASQVVGVFLAIQCWGHTAKKFVAGWISAAVLMTVLSAAFDWFLFSATSNVPWAAQAFSLIMTSFLAVLTVYALTFLALFAAVAWISHRQTFWNFGIFALAGSAVMITPYLIQGIDVVSYFALTWWPFRAKDIAIGAIAGVAFWHMAHPTRRTPLEAA